VCTGSISILYFDGALDVNNIASAPTIVDSDLASIGQEYDAGPVTSDHFDGILDEVRISSIARNASWIATEFNNQNDTSTFLTVGDEEINPDNWNFRKLITINSSKVSSDLTDYPMLFNNVDSDLASKAQSDASDIVFTSADGRTRLDHEVENYTSSSGNLTTWVRIPELSSTVDTKIYIYYGNENAYDLSYPTGVWDANYTAVYHLSELPTGTVYDSTSNNIDLTPNAMEAADHQSGKVDGGINFDGSPERLVSSSTITIEAFTIEAWASVDDWSDWGTFVDVDDADFWRLFGIDDITRVAMDYDGTNYDLTLGNSGSTWHHWISRYDGSSTLRGFKDGSMTAQTPSAGDWGSLTGRVILGSWWYEDGSSWTDYLNGRLDEVRISNISRSSDWISTEYSNMNDPSSFYSIGDEEINPANWQYRKLVTINSSKVTGDLTNFPVLINTTDSDLSSKARSDGYDIIFTGLDGRTRLDHEVESYTSGTGALIAWIRIPSLSATADTCSYMYYGNSGQTTSLENSTGVWSNGYIGVYHMVEETGNLNNSASSSNDGTRVNTPTRVTGWFGYGQAFTGGGADDYFNIGDLGIADGVNKNITLSAWAHIDNSATEDWGKIISKRNDADTGYIYYLSLDDDSPDKSAKFYAKDDTTTDTTIAKSCWVHFAGTYGGTIKTVYINGTAKITDSGGAGGAITSSNTDVTLGAKTGPEQNFGGILDEIRLSNKNRSAAWIGTEYNNQNATSLFYEIGSEEGGGGAAVSYTDCGAAYIFFGYGGIGSDDINAASANVTINGSSTNANFGWDVSDIGDVNGDGKDDIIIGAPGYSSDKGRAYIFYGRTDWSGVDDAENDADVIITGESSNDNFSMSVSGAGDVDNNNYDDVIIGAPYYGSGGGTGWWDGDWSYRKKLTFNNADQNEAMVNFPVLVNLSSSNFDYSKAESDGTDLRFVDADNTTELKYHIEDWDSSGNSYVWVNVTNIAASSATDHIWMYYGNSGASDVQDVSGTYNDDYEGVYHLNETDIDGGSGDIKDSASTNDGTTSGMDTNDQVPGKIDGSFDFDRRN
jgi:hypothetical protein